MHIIVIGYSTVQYSFLTLDLFSICLQNTGKNKLEGFIPSEIALFTSLTSLDLSESLRRKLGA